MPPGNQPLDTHSPLTAQHAHAHTSHPTFSPCPVHLLSSLLQLLLSYPRLSKRQCSLQVMEAPGVLLQPSYPHYPSIILPIGIVSFLTTKQLGHSSKGVVIPLELEGYPVGIDVL